MARLEGKTALITGAGSGIGRETCLLFAREGAEIVAVDINLETAQETAAAARELGINATYAKADVSKAADCERMVRHAEETFNKLDILFNNAGIMHGEDEDAVNTDEAIWDLTMAINLKGVWLGCKYGIPALRRAGGGSIINTASFVALMGAATPQIAYTASKGGVLAMTRELSVVHARENIRVNALCPAGVWTDALVEWRASQPDPEQVDDYLNRLHALGYCPEPAEIAVAAAFLCSDEARFMTGAIVPISGGSECGYKL